MVHLEYKSQVAVLRLEKADLHSVIYKAQSTWNVMSQEIYTVPFPPPPFLMLNIVEPK